MNRTIRWVVCGTALAWLSFGVRNACAQDQQTMNREAAQDFAADDAELNKVYKQLSAKMDGEDLEELRAAQRLWVQFRDAEAKFEADLDARGGSLYPQLYNGSRSALTKARTEELRRILKGE